MYLDNNKITDFHRYDEIYLQNGGQAILVNLEYTLDEPVTTVMKLGQILSSRARSKVGGIVFKWLWNSIKIWWNNKDIKTCLYCIINPHNNGGRTENIRGHTRPQTVRSILKYLCYECIVFLIAKNAQNSYGVKTGDYMRYRRYCTRKVNKLRKAMDYKYGSRTKFVKKDITADRPDDKRILQIAMFSCEKYWAYANECKFN